MRMFPAVAIAVGLAALSVGAVLAQSGGSAEVRIAAMRLEDGRIEFALQQRDAAGSWGERILPDRRFFPATGSGRWLTSSSLAVEVSPADRDYGGLEFFRGSWTYYNPYQYIVAFQWEGRINIRNNTDRSMSNWDARMYCNDASGNPVINDESYSTPQLLSGDSTVLEFSDYDPAGAPTECHVEITPWGERSVRYTLPKPS